MSRRGQKQPYRVDYQWDDNPELKGCVRFTYKDQMIAFLEKQSTLARNTDRKLDQSWKVDQ